MKSKLYILITLAALLVASSINAAEPLRVFIRGGKKTHGPGAHEHEQFLKDWTKLLKERGMTVDGGMEFPAAEQLAKTDVLVLHAQDGGEVPADKRPGMDAFLKRGGGVVVIHAAAVPANNKGDGAAYLKSVVGGTWVWGTTKWLEGPMFLYYSDRDHPITREASNFQMDDEIYYDMDLSPDIHVLATCYTPNATSARDAKRASQFAAGKRPSVYDIQPLMWTYEKDNHRAFVSIPGHLYVNFERPNYRAILLRGIAWAGKRSNVDEYCNSIELASLRYPEGGPTAPEKSAAKLEVHPEFKIGLVASEPLVDKPINLDWDAKGRLWVAETPEYPNGRLEPNVDRWKESGSLVKTGDLATRPARDRISILSDPDASGRFTKKTVFYEGLERVTSFVFYKDGVIASAAPDIWLIRDTKGTGKADKAEKLYTGMGFRDTHAVINNLRWGMDGWIYATLGYSAGHPTSPDGSKDFGNLSSGVVRFKADGSAFEQVSSKGGNTWGLDITWDNEVFYTQPTSGDLLMHVVVPEGVLAQGKVGNTTSFKPLIIQRKSYPLMSYEMQAYVQIDLVGSFTASAGCAMYDGGSWPAEWNYSYFTTEPTINIVHQEAVKPDGDSYSAEKTREPEFIGGRDMWFRPIETRIGPDGALYVLDFYNQAVVHNDTRGTQHGPANAAVRPDRDHYFGRIWRVDHKQAKHLVVPDLSRASAGDLVKAFEQPNRHVRMNAFRLLVDGNQTSAAPRLQALLSSSKAPEGRVSALWALHRLGRLGMPVLMAALKDSDPAIRKNALEVAELESSTVGAARKEVASRLNDSNARVRLEAIIALGAFPIDADSARALVEVYPKLDDNWSKSVALGVAAKNAAMVLDAAFSSPNPGALDSFVKAVTQQLAQKQDNEQAARLVVAIASKPASTDSLKRSVLESLAQGLRSGNSPAWSTDLQQAMRTLINSSDAALAGTALPLAARWDKNGTLSEEVKKGVRALAAKLNDSSQSDDARASVVVSLLGVREGSPEVIAPVVDLLTSNASNDLKKRVIEALGSTGDPAAGKALMSNFVKLDRVLQMDVFNQLLKRADWAQAFLDALQSRTVDASLLGPANLFRLRTHPNAAVAKRANSLIDELRGPEAKEKDTLIARFTPIVSQPGNAVKGKELFMQNCGICHRLGEIGKDVGPILTGMGAHGPAGLLVSVLDPNREVDPSFIAFSVETRDGESYEGIKVRENKTAVVIRNATGEKEIPRSEVKFERNTGRSLMPEGFEALGGESLRDILAFVCANESRFRFVDLSQAFTADTRKGLYHSEEKKEDTVSLIKFGPVSVEGVPFNIVDPAKSAGGKNVMVLKGGSGFAMTMPQKVEAKLGFAVSRLHFLGGIAGWGFPGGKPDASVMTVTAIFADGQKEEMVFKNGNEFADYIREVDVPGSKLTKGLVSQHQLRWFTKPLQHKGVVEKLVMESPGNGPAATTVAITAELSDGPGGAVSTAASEPAAPPAKLEWGPGTKVLLVGGGSSHDFDRFFNKADVAILKGAQFSANYTEDNAVVVQELPRVNVGLLSINKKEFGAMDVRKTLFDFVDAGKGLVLLHAGVWYNHPAWPEYNRQLVGGGARGHDKLGPFEVKVTVPDHPVMRGVPANFPVTDELYYMNPDPQGLPIEVLATATSPLSGKTFPSVWIVKNPKTRIVCIALGHDDKVHGLPEFKALLVNAINWANGK